MGLGVMWGNFSPNKDDTHPGATEHNLLPCLEELLHRQGSCLEILTSCDLLLSGGDKECK